MRALLIGAVEGTRVALDAIAAAADWELAAVATLPLELAHRHTDFVDLRPEAAAHGARLIPVSNCNAEGFVAEVRELAPDMTFVIGWSQICGPALRGAGGRIIGYHTAALPRMRGRATIPWTILLDEKITASTVFEIDDGVDSGHILAQRFFHVAADETAATLYDKHMVALRRMLDELLPGLAAGGVPGEAQDDRFATWAARRRPEDGLIDWSRPADEVYRLIRAVGAPYPGAFTRNGGEKLVIWNAEPWAAGTRHHARPGQVIAREGQAFAVCCGDGRALQVTRHDAPPDRLPALHARLGF